MEIDIYLSNNVLNVKKEFSFTATGIIYICSPGLVINGKSDI